MTKKVDFTIYTDGGGSGKTARIASACMMECPGGGINLAATWGPGTSNEAELMAGLMGLSAIHAFCRVKGCEVNSIHWVGDSEYVLKSATHYLENWEKREWRASTGESVKNIGLWKAFLLLKDNYKIDTQHVRGHTGHMENEMCDTACTWCVQNGPTLLDRASSFFTRQQIDRMKRKQLIDSTSWFVFDGKEWLDQLRVGGPGLSEAAWLARKIIKGG